MVKGGGKGGGGTWKLGELGLSTLTLILPAGDESSCLLCSTCLSFYLLIFLLLLLLLLLFNLPDLYAQVAIKWIYVKDHTDHAPLSSKFAFYIRLTHELKDVLLISTFIPLRNTGSWRHNACKCSDSTMQVHK